MGSDRRCGQFALEVVAPGGLDLYDQNLICRQKETKMLRIEELRVKLGDREILKNINLEIKPGRNTHPVRPQRLGEDDPADDHHGLSPVQDHFGQDFFQGAGHNRYADQRTGHAWASACLTSGRPRFTASRQGRWSRYAGTTATSIPTSLRKR